MPDRRRPFILLAAIAALVAAIAVVLVRSGDDPFELDTAWGAPTAIDVGADRDPLGVLRAGLTDADGPVELGPLRLDPEHTVLTSLESHANAPAGVSGTVPTWFPALDGALHVHSALRGEVEAVPADGLTPTADAGARTRSRYTATQLSLIATTRIIDELVAEVVSVLDDTWPEVTVFDHGGVDFEQTVRASGQRDGLDRPDTVDVEFATSASFPGVVVIQVSADYTAAGPLRPPPRALDGSGADVAAFADAEGWPEASWAATDGVDLTAIPWQSTVMTWTSGERDVATVADDLVARLGFPEDGDVDGAAGVLTFGDGTARVEQTDQATSIEWWSEQRGWDQVDPGPLATVEHGVPATVVDVDARPLDVGRGEQPTGDVVATFEQAGMIAIDGAVTLDASSGVSYTTAHPGPSYSHTANQLVVVDTPLSAEDVGERLQTALADPGVEDIDVDEGGYYVDDPVVTFNASANGGAGAGNPRYWIEVGSLQERPNLVAVWMAVSVDFERPVPETPAFLTDYFAEPRDAADEGWSPTRWYVVRGRELNGDGVLFRGELDWVVDVPGPDGLRAAVTTLTAISGVEPDAIAEDLYWFEGDDDWAVGLTWGHTYEPVTVSWEGGFEDVG